MTITSKCLDSISNNFISLETGFFLCKIVKYTRLKLIILFIILIN